MKARIIRAYRIFFSGFGVLLMGMCTKLTGGERASLLRESLILISIDVRGERRRAERQDQQA
jgi:hypothetical protein